MNTSMKRALYMPLLALAAALVSTPAIAQSPTKVSVPFSFQAGEKSVDAGQYTITKLGSSRLLIRDSHGKVVASVAARQVTRKEIASNPQVVFENGEIKQVWMADSNTGYEIEAGSQRSLLAKNLNK